MALKFKCQNCGEDIIVRYLKVGEVAECKYCGARNVVPETAIESEEKPNYTESRKVIMESRSAFDGHKELYNYITKAEGISRSALNIMAFIGLFIFGWLIALVFSFLGKEKQGWAYFIPVIIFAFGVSQFAPKLAAVLAPLIYIVAWVHANIILSRYKSAARQRIAEMELQSETRIDEVLEKGILLHKALGEKELAAGVLANALRMPGGDPLLLSCAGVVMNANKRLNEAAEFLDRALTNTKDEALIKQLTKTLHHVEKRRKKLERG